MGNRTHGYYYKKSNGIFTIAFYTYVKDLFFHFMDVNNVATNRPVQNGKSKGFCSRQAFVFN